MNAPGLGQQIETAACMHLVILVFSSFLFELERLMGMLTSNKKKITSCTGGQDNRKNFKDHVVKTLAYIWR